MKPEPEAGGRNPFPIRIEDFEAVVEIVVDSVAVDIRERITLDSDTIVVGVALISICIEWTVVIAVEKAVVIFVAGVALQVTV